MDSLQQKIAPVAERSRHAYSLAALSGLLLALSFPSPGLALLAWGAFIPLFQAVSGASRRQAFRCGMITGMVAYTGILYWLNIVMTTYGKLPWVVSLLLTLVMAAYLSLYPAIVIALVRGGESVGLSPLFTFPVAWVGFEYLRAFALTGFPWASLAYTQYRTLPLIQIADITGIYGVSFLVALANVALYRLARSLAKNEPLAPAIRGAALMLGAVVAVLGYGAYRLNIPERGAAVKVALVQGNIPQDVKWNPAFQEQTVQTYERLSRSEAVASPQLMVWPESALPFFFQTEPQYAARVTNLARELKSSLVVGSPAFDRDGDRIRYLNSAFLIGPAGEVLGRGDKLHLVPFGEYVPLASMLPFVHKLVEGVGDFSPGREAVPLVAPFGKIGVLVCFEGIFPEISREYVRLGSQVLVNITNDAWYGRSSAPYQHLSMAVFRSVENRVPLVRAANTGISAIIDSKGHFQGMTGLFQEAVLTGEIRLGSGRTLYNRLGDLFAGACLLATALAGIGIYRKSSRGTGSLPIPPGDEA